MGGAGGYAAGYYHGGSRRRRPSVPLAPSVVALESHNPRVGPDPAKVTIVAFIDYQCPFCHRVANTFKALRADRADELALVVKHRPLPSHPDARGSAHAVQAAHRQGKAWELHERLLEQPRSQAPEDLIAHAEALGLDVPRFQADIADPEIAKQVEQDETLATAVGATATPTTFVNGVGVRGARPREAFEELIRRELRAVDAAIADGVALADVYESRCRANVAAGTTL